MLKLIRKYLNLVKDVFFACALIFSYSKITKVIKSLGVTNLKIFRFVNSHHGFYYFTGILNAKKVFVKVDTKFHILSNDIQVYEKSDGDFKDSLVKIFDYHLDEDLQIIVFDFVESKELTSMDLLETPELSIELCNLIFKINKLGFIHRDIRLDNFLLVNDEIKVIDFTFAYSLKGDSEFKDLSTSSKSNLRVLKMLGRKLKPNNYEWNDFFSMKEILQSLNTKSFTKDQLTELSKCIVKLSQSIDGNSYYVEI